MTLNNSPKLHKKCDIFGFQRLLRFYEHVNVQSFVDVLNDVSPRPDQTHESNERRNTEPDVKAPY